MFCTLYISLNVVVFQASGQILDGDHIPDPDEGHEGPLCSKGNRNRAGTGVVEKRDEEMSLVFSTHLASCQLHMHLSGDVEKLGTFRGLQKKVLHFFCR